MNLESILKREDVPGDVKEELKNYAEQLKNYAEKLKKNAEMNDLKEKHSSHMIHELRTPLNAILGFSELLLDENLNPEQKEYVNVIHDSGKTMLNFVNSSLDYQKLVLGRVPIENQFFNLKDSLENILYSFKPLADKGNITLELIYLNDIPINYFGDKGKIDQIITNLVGNAIKYTDEGEVTIEVIKTLENFYSIKVKDTGKGISEENISKLFQKFYQIRGSNDKHKGSGLGLSICKNLVELLRGRIEVESELGKGSTFTVDLPLDELSILYIDSDKTQRSYNSTLFDNLNYNHDSKDDFDYFLNLDGQELSQQIKKYNLIVLNKDNQSSDQLVKRIRNTELGSSIKIIGITDSEFKDELHLHGYDILLKSYSNKEIISKTIYNLK